MFEALTYYANFAVSTREIFDEFTFVPGPPGTREAFRADGKPIFTWNQDHCTIVAGRDGERHFLFHYHPWATSDLVARCASLEPLFVVSNEPPPDGLKRATWVKSRKSCVGNALWDGKVFRYGQQLKFWERNTWLKLFGRMPRARLKEEKPCRPGSN